jgi:hypothetical protein
MRKRILAQFALATVLVVASCGRDGLLASSGQTRDAGGGDAARFPTLGGLGIRLPDGGLAVLLGDGGLGQLLCGPEVRLGAPCSSDLPACVLSSLGGLCACVSGTYLCPLNTKAGPLPCPPGAATGAGCLSPLSTCMGGSAAACLCGLGTYLCL